MFAPFPQDARHRVGNQPVVEKHMVPAFARAPALVLYVILWLSPCLIFRFAIAFPPLHEKNAPQLSP
jgi:hypothetical protein